MKIHQDINQIPAIHRPVLTTGTFDGVHLGHAMILERIRKSAQEIDGESVLFSFHPHPRMVLYPQDHGLQLLQTPSEKRRSLEAIGLDHLIEVPFTMDFARQNARDFVEDILVERIGVRKVVIGYDHRFGKSREGDIDLLRRCGKDWNFEVEEIPARVVDAVNVSSTKIRKALLEGRVGDANKALGRPYELTGTVVRGKGLGREIGFPTANLQVEEDYKLIPGDGVYAVSVGLGGESFQGMMNIGFRPTVQNESVLRTVEVNVFGLNREFYGERMNVRFTKRIRAEMKFASLEELKRQLEADRNSILTGK